MIFEIALRVFHNFLKPSKKMSTTTTSTTGNNNVHQRFISIGANRISGSSDWYRLPSDIYENQVYTNQNIEYENTNCIRVDAAIKEKYRHLDLFAYSANQFVAIYSPYYNRILCTLKGHSERVNDVSFMIYSNSEEFDVNTIYITSVGGKEVIIWKLNINQSNITYEIVQTIKSKTHLTKVTSLEQRFIVVADSDGHVFVYEKKSQLYELVQTFKHHKAIEAISMIKLFDHYMVACGGVDFNIHLYFLESNKSVLVLKGHEDWIRALSFKFIPIDNCVYLASASQDNRIRLWKITKVTEQDANHSKTSDSLLEEELLVNLYNTYHFSFESNYYQLTLDALLTGHEDWVHSLNWHPIPNMLQLVSTSMDRTMTIWSPTSKGGVWLNQFRMGEFGGLSGLFGQMGYFSGCFSMFADYCMGTAFHGSFHLWKLREKRKRMETNG